MTTSGGLPSSASTAERPDRALSRRSDERHHFFNAVIRGRGSKWLVRVECAPPIARPSRSDRTPQGSGANRPQKQMHADLTRRLQAPITAFQTAGAVRPCAPSRPSRNCPLRMRCISSIPAIVMTACRKSLKPNITAIRASLLGGLARSGCSGTSTTVTSWPRAASRLLSARALPGEMPRSRPM